MTFPDFIKKKSPRFTIFSISHGSFFWNFFPRNFFPPRFRAKNAKFSRFQWFLRFFLLFALTFNIYNWIIWGFSFRMMCFMLYFDAQNSFWLILKFWKNDDFRLFSRKFFSSSILGQKCQIEKISMVFVFFPATYTYL